MYYDLMKNHIAKGGYRMLDVKDKIARLWTEGQIDDRAREELNALAEAGASPDAERPEYLAMLRAFSSRLDELAARIAALEQSESPALPEGEYESWQAWDGVSDKYQPGAIVQHKGKTWISTHPGQNVWEPGVIGTEKAWSLYESGAM